MKAKKVHEILEDGLVSSLPKILPKEEEETVLDRNDRLRKEVGIEIDEGADFERGKDPKSAMGLGMVEIELDYHNFHLDEYTGKPDMDDDDTAWAVSELKKSGLRYEFKESGHGPVLVKLKGTRDQLAPFVAEYLDEPEDMVRNAFSQWDGIEVREVWKLMGY